VAELDAERIAVALVIGTLPLVVLGDAIARDLERIQRLLGRLRDRRLDLLLRDPEPELGEIDPVELGRQLDQRRVSAGTHIAHDLAHRGVNVGRRLALVGEERRERGLEGGVGRC
jgi:hypothetical protein